MFYDEVNLSGILIYINSFFVKSENKRYIVYPTFLTKLIIMRHLSTTCARFSVLFIVFLLQFSASRAQLDLDKDTVSKSKAHLMRDTYRNHVGQGGVKATEHISLPLNKLKTITDMLTANNIDSVKVMIVSLRSSDY